MRVHTSATRSLIPLLGTFALLACEGSVSLPIAAAGADQTVNTGTFVQLDASGSSDPQNRLITYQWTFASRPLGSQAQLIDPDSAKASFMADMPGEYMLKVTVSNSLRQNEATVKVTASACGSGVPVVSDISASAEARVGSSVQLAATVTHPDNAAGCNLGRTLSYQWSFAQLPPQSQATLNSATSPNPSFTADVAGTYGVELVVTDSVGRSSKPKDFGVSVAACGGLALSNGRVTTGPIFNGSNVQLAVDVQKSTCGGAAAQQITLRWELAQKPQGSAASLSSSTAESPTFVADVAGGSYLATVTATDGLGAVSNTVQIEVPVSNCGSFRPVVASFTTAQNSGTGAFDPWTLTAAAVTNQNDDATTCPTRFNSSPYTLTWRVVDPTGSPFLLSSTTGSPVTFSARANATYTIELTATDKNGLTSAPVRNTISTACVLPGFTVSGPTATRAVHLDGTVVLNPLTFFTNDFITIAAPATATCLGADTFQYEWTLTARPAGSNAELLAPNSATPSFFADVAGGTYKLAATVTSSLGSVVSTAALSIVVDPAPAAPALTGLPTFAVENTTVHAALAGAPNAVYACTAVNGLLAAGSDAGTLSAAGLAMLTITTGSAGQLTVSCVQFDGPVRSPAATAGTTVLQPSVIPAIQVATALTTGRTYTASVRTQPFATYTWSLSLNPNAAIVSANGAAGVFSSDGTINSIRFTSGSVGPLSITVTQQDVFGAQQVESTPVTVFPEALPPQFISGLNSVDGKASATATRTYTLAVAARNGFTYRWTITNGSIAQGAETGVFADGLNTLTFTAGAARADNTPATMTIACTETNAAGDASASTLFIASVFPNPRAPTFLIATVPDGVTVTSGRITQTFDYTATLDTNAHMHYAWIIVGGTFSPEGAPPLRPTDSAGTFINLGAQNRVTFQASDAFPSTIPTTVTLQVKELNEIDDSAKSPETSLTAFPKPITPAITTATTDVTAGDIVTASVTSPRLNLFYDWTIINGTFAGGSATATGTSVTFTAGTANGDGTPKNLILSVQERNGTPDVSAFFDLTFHVFPRPVAPTVVLTRATVTLADGDSVTEGDAIRGSITNSAQPGITFSWTGTHINPPTGLGTTFDFTGVNDDAAGNPVTAQISARASNAIGAQADSATRTLLVLPLPADPTITLATGDGTTTVASGAGVTAGSFKATTNTQKSTITYQWTISPLANRANVTGDTTTNVHFDALANADNTNATVSVTIGVANAIGKTKTALATLVVHPAPQTPTIHIVGPNGNDGFVTQGSTGVRAQVDARAHFHYLWTYAVASPSGIAAGTLTNPGGTAGDLDGLHNFVLFTVPADATNIRLSCTELNDIEFASAAGKRQATAVPAPQITTFAASPTATGSGGQVTLSFEFSNGNGSIDNGVGAVTSPGSVQVIVTTETTFNLRVTNPADSTTTRSAAVTVLTGLAFAKQSFGSDPSSTEGAAIATFPDGSFITTGKFSGAGEVKWSPTGTPATATGATDMYVARYNSDGSLQWVQTAGAAGTSTFGAGVVSTGTDGSAVVAGSFGGTISFGTTSLTAVGPSELFVVKFDATGAVVWANHTTGTPDPGGSTLTAAAVAADQFGNIAVTGNFTGTVTFGTGDRSSVTGAGIFVAYYNPDGSFSTSVSATATAGTIVSHGIAFTGNTGTVITGDFSGTATFDVGTSLDAQGLQDAFVVKYETDGFTVAFATSVGGLGATTSSRATSGFVANSSFVITGSFTSTVKFGTGLGSPTLTATGAQDVFVARYLAFGAPAWQARAGGPATASGSGLGISTQADGSIVVVGQFDSTAFAFSGTSSIVSAGASDAFIARYANGGAFGSARSAGGAGEDAANAVASFTDLGAVLTGFVSSNSPTDPTLSIFGAGDPHRTELSTAPNATDSFVAKYYSYP